MHPGLNKEIDVKHYVVDVDERHRWVRHSAPARDGAVSSGRWLWRWPNLALNLYPDAMNVERYDPVTPGRTRLRYSYSFRRPCDREANDAVIRASSQVTAEDIAICESVQRVAPTTPAGSAPSTKAAWRRSSDGSERPSTADPRAIADEARGVVVRRPLM